MNKQLVVNWHILEACNFGCRYCFAHWPSPEKKSAEIWRDRTKWCKLLSALHELPDYVAGGWDGVRLNLAGGEPMLLWRKGVLGEILNYANALGFQLSIISNGYLMDDEFIAEWAPKLQVIGISADSADTGINDRIGRRAKSGGGQISCRRLAEIFRLARRANPNIECKLNTVVNALNWRDDMRSLVGKSRPDRWKVFQMLPLADTPEIERKQEPLKISGAQFRRFLDRHGDFRRIMSPESNDEMTDSYVMVDPLGRFYQNESAAVGYRHVVSDPVHQTGAEKAIGQVRFDEGKFKRRYIPVYNALDNG